MDRPTGQQNVNQSWQGLDQVLVKIRRPVFQQQAALHSTHFPPTFHEGGERKLHFCQGNMYGY